MENLYYSKKASDITIGDYILIEQQPCQITMISSRLAKRNGFHQVEKTFHGKCFFDGKQYKLVSSANNTVDIPTLQYSDYEIFDIVDGYCLMIDSDQNHRKKIRLPLTPVSDQILELYFNDDTNKIPVVVLKTMNREEIISIKNIL